MTEGIFSTALLGPLPEPAPGLTNVEIRVLQVLLKVAVPDSDRGLDETNIYDYGAPMWHDLARKGFVLWFVDHWRLLDEDATRRALAVEVLEDRWTTTFR